MGVAVSIGGERKEKGPMFQRSLVVFEGERVYKAGTADEFLRWPVLRSVHYSRCAAKHVLGMVAILKGNKLE